MNLNPYGPYGGMEGGSGLIKKERGAIKWMISEI